MSESEKSPWWSALPAALSVVVPLLIAVPRIPFKITNGDGGELLTAMLTFGVAHPSGYPLYTLLGAFFGRFPVLPDVFWVIFWLSTVPVALSSGLIYRISREGSMGRAWALSASLMWVFLVPVLVMAVRIEVYPIHVLLTLLSLYGVQRYAKAPDQTRWALLATTAVALGMTNHLTSVLMVPAVVIGLLWSGGRRIVNFKTLSAILGLGLLAGSLYIYLPLASLAAEDGSTIAWGRPGDPAMFWEHVRGAEYDQYRSFDHIPIGLADFGRRMQEHAFPGWWLVSVIGGILWLRQAPRFFLPLLVYVACALVYIASYKIGDIGTYYPPIYAAMAIGAGYGLQFLGSQLRLHDAPWGRGLVLAGMVAAMGGWFGNAVYWSQSSTYDGVLSADVGVQAVDEVPHGSFLLTNTDAHTFTMWYQTYVVQELGRVVHIDMRTKHHPWYRDHLRARYPDVKWPVDAVMRQDSQLIVQLMKLNPDRRMFHLEAKEYDWKGTFAVLQGWTHEIFHSRDAKDHVPTRWAKHHYVARSKQVAGALRVYDSSRTFESGVDDVLCAVDWHKGHPSFTVLWTFLGPDGQKITHRQTTVGPKGNWTTRALPTAEQAPGEWFCVVEAQGLPKLTLDFTLE